MLLMRRALDWYADFIRIDEAHLDAIWPRERVLTAKELVDLDLSPVEIRRCLIAIWVRYGQASEVAEICGSDQGMHTARRLREARRDGLWIRDIERALCVDCERGDNQSYEQILAHWHEVGL